MKHVKLWKNVILCFSVEKKSEKIVESECKSQEEQVSFIQREEALRE